MDSCGKKDRCLGMRPSFGEGGKGRFRPCIQSKLFFFPCVSCSPATQVIQKRPGVDSFSPITSLIQAEFFRWQGFDGGILQKLPIGRDASSFFGVTPHPQEESAHEPSSANSGFQSGLSPRSRSICKS